jgi:putative ABC transport system permease protein
MFLKLIIRNAFRHRLRTLLTMLGIVIAVLAFGLLRTVVDAWSAGVDAASSTRLVTRNAISLVFPLPLTYEEKIRQVPGVKTVSRANWFGGVYIDKRNFFPQFAVDGRAYLELYPEYRVAPEQLKAFLLDRKGCVVGRKLAQTYGWRLGDAVPLRGTIFPGNWEFVVRAIYDGEDAGTNESQLFFHWDYLNETLKRTAPRRANQVGIFLVGISDPDAAAQTSREVDALFRNSLAETLTETEKAFQLGFFSMTEAIVVAIRIVSFVIIVIIMAVMANTMAMTSRERGSEYATLKALGLRRWALFRLVGVQAAALAFAGTALGTLLGFAAARGVSALAPKYLIAIGSGTVAVVAVSALAMATIAALLPARFVARIDPATAFRR